MYKSSAKSKKGFKSIVSLLLVAAILITGALAYLTATDSKTNKFTVGNVSIELTEPNWDANNPDGTLENIVPGQTMPKDPQIENTGKNDAYVYIMVTVPKKDQITVNENGSAVVKDNLQLFTYDVNENWTLIKSKSDDANENNYYVYAYNTALAPQGKTEPLFEEVTFANIVSGQIESTEELEILVNGYAIQSNSIDVANAEEAWDIYANQNGWDWPLEVPEGYSSLNFVDNNGNILHTEIAEAGTPVDMYFDNALAKDGFTFDWVDANTGDVAYSGMPMPEEDTELVPDYTETGYGSEAGDYFKYFIKENDEYGVHAVLYSISGPTSPESPTTVVIPSHITFTLDEDAVQQDNGTSPSTYVNSGTSLANFTLTDGGYQASLYASLNAGTHKIPVVVDGSEAYRPNLGSIAKEIVYPDTIREISTGYEGSNGEAAVVEKIIFPYGVKKIKWLKDLPHLTEVYLPNSVVEFGGFGTTTAGTITLNTLELPKSLTKCGKFNAVQIDTLIINGDIENLELGYGPFNNVIFAEGVTKIPANFATGMNTNKYSVINNISLPSTIKFIGSKAFQFNSLPQFELPSNITTIEDYAFSQSSGLIGEINNITNVGNSAFNNCKGITSVTFSNDATIIKQHAFYGCTNLENVVIPDGMTEIESGAFTGCTSLKEVSVPSGCNVASDAFPATCTVTYR